MSAAEESNAAFTAGRWLREDLDEFASMVGVEPGRFADLIDSDEFALDVVLARAAYELETMPATFGAGDG